MLGVEYQPPIISKTHYLASKHYLEIKFAKNWYAIQIQVFGYSPNFSGVIQATEKATEIEIEGKLLTGSLAVSGGGNKVFYTGGKVVLYTDVVNSQMYVIASTRSGADLLTFTDYTTYDTSGMTQLTFA